MRARERKCFSVEGKSYRKTESTIEIMPVICTWRVQREKTYEICAHADVFSLYGRKLI